jgi:hypothetical protein
VRQSQTKQISNSDFSLETWLHNFETALFKAIRSIYEKMESRDSIDVSQINIEALFFRNCHIYETIILLLNEQYLIGAELLLRSLFEGSVIVEWCIVDPKTRSQSLMKTVWKGEQDLIDDGFFKNSTKEQVLLSKAITAIDEQNIKGLPNFKQMVESLTTYRKEYSYTLYKYLSKKNHGVDNNIYDFLSCKGKMPIVLGVKKNPPKERCISCRAMASVIQMNNIKAISLFDSNICYDKISAIESIWGTLYTLLKTKGM